MVPQLTRVWWAPSRIASPLLLWISAELSTADPLVITPPLVKSVEGAPAAPTGALRLSANAAPAGAAPPTVMVVSDHCEMIWPRLVMLTVGLVDCT